MLIVTKFHNTTKRRTAHLSARFLDGCSCRTVVRFNILPIADVLNSLQAVAKLLAHPKVVGRFGLPEQQNRVLPVDNVAGNYYWAVLAGDAWEKSAQPVTAVVAKHNKETSKP